MIEIAPNPIEAFDPTAAREFETAVSEALGETREPLVIRFGLWNGEDDGRRFVCKVESVPVAAVGGPPAWRWWSPLVRTPAELAGHVRQAMRARQRPQPAAASAPEFWGWGAAGA